jgi:hypothetical protein
MNRRYILQFHIQRRLIRLRLSQSQRRPWQERQQPMMLELSSS